MLLALLPGCSTRVDPDAAVARIAPPASLHWEMRLARPRHLVERVRQLGEGIVLPALLPNDARGLLVALWGWSEGVRPEAIGVIDSVDPDAPVCAFGLGSPGAEGLRWAYAFRLRSDAPSARPTGGWAVRARGRDRVAAPDEATLAQVADYAFGRLGSHAGEAAFSLSATAAAVARSIRPAAESILGDLRSTLAAQARQARATRRRAPMFGDPDAVPAVVEQMLRPWADLASEAGSIDLEVDLEPTLTVELRLSGGAALAEWASRLASPADLSVLDRLPADAALAYATSESPMERRRSSETTLRAIGRILGPSATAADLAALRELLAEWDAAVGVGRAWALVPSPDGGQATIVAVAALEDEDEDASALGRALTSIERAATRPVVRAALRQIGVTGIRHGRPRAYRVGPMEVGVVPFDADPRSVVARLFGATPELHWTHGQGLLAAAFGAEARPRLGGLIEPASRLSERRSIRGARQVGPRTVALGYLDPTVLAPFIGAVSPSRAGRLSGASRVAGASEGSVVSVSVGAPDPNGAAGTAATAIVRLSVTDSLFAAARQFLRAYAAR